MHEFSILFYYCYYYYLLLLLLFLSGIQRDTIIFIFQREFFASCSYFFSVYIAYHHDSVIGWRSQRNATQHWNKDLLKYSFSRNLFFKTTCVTMPIGPKYRKISTDVQVQSNIYSSWKTIICIYVPPAMLAHWWDIRHGSWSQFWSTARGSSSKKLCSAIWGGWTKGGISRWPSTLRPGVWLVCIFKCETISSKPTCPLIPSQNTVTTVSWLRILNL